MVVRKVFKERMKRIDETRHLAWKSPPVGGTAGPEGEPGIRRAGKRGGSMMSEDHWGQMV